MIPGKHNMDIGTWDTNKNTAPQLPIVNNTVPKSLAPNINVRPPAWTGPVRAQTQPQTSQLGARPAMPQPGGQMPPNFMAGAQAGPQASGPPPQANPAAVMMAQHIGMVPPSMVPQPPQPQPPPQAQQPMPQVPPPQQVSFSKIYFCFLQCSKKYFY